MILEDVLIIRNFRLCWVTPAKQLKWPGTDTKQKIPQNGNRMLPNRSTISQYSHNIGSKSHKTGLRYHECKETGRNRLEMGQKRWERSSNTGKWSESLINFTYFFLIRCCGMVRLWIGGNVHRYYA